MNLFSGAKGSLFPHYGHDDDDDDADDGAGGTAFTLTVVVFFLRNCGNEYHNT